MMNELGKICSEWKKQFAYSEEPTEKDIMHLAKKVWSHSKNLPENEVRDFVERFTGVKI